ncbi:MAG: DUF1700 domain-containing protein [Ruminococcus sp.]|nr:DUF1700 domain-containing protein [Ruminococcus sp.]
MNKLQFISELRGRLAGLPCEDIENYIQYYSEMIDDRVEDGMSEAQAVADIGSVDEIVTEILRTTPLAKLVKEKVKPKRKLRTWEIVLLAVGSPLWLTLGFAALCIILAVYVVIWAVVVALICVNIALFATAAALFACVAGLAVSSHIPEMLMCLGAALIIGGLSILMFLLVKAAIKGTVWLSKKIVLGIKSCFVRKGEV